MLKYAMKKLEIEWAQYATLKKLIILDDEFDALFHTIYTFEGVYQLISLLIQCQKQY